MMNLACALGLSAPTYIEPDSSFQVKKDLVKNVLESAKAANSKNIYIYYHDSKSQNMANNIRDRIQGKVPSDCNVSVVDKTSGTPKYPAQAQINPNGVVIFYQQ